MGGLGIFMRILFVRLRIVDGEGRARDLGRKRENSCSVIIKTIQEDEIWKYTFRVLQKAS
jgi:hypothetical protein